MTGAGVSPVEEEASLESWETDGGWTAAGPMVGPAFRRGSPNRDRRRWATGTWTAVGLALGAALGSTIFDDLALATGIGVALGAVVDLRQLRR